MQQFTNSNAAMTERFDNHQRFEYGGGAISILIFLGLAIGLFHAHDEFTSSNTEWHLFSTKLPIIIPNQVMVGVWWVAFLICLSGVLLSLSPAVNVIVGENEITAQGLFTRKFTTIAFKDILDLKMDTNRITATDRTNNKIDLSRMFLSRSAFRIIREKLRTSAANAL